MSGPGRTITTDAHVLRECRRLIELLGGFLHGTHGVFEPGGEREAWQGLIEVASWLAGEARGRLVRTPHLDELTYLPAMPGSLDAMRNAAALVLNRGDELVRELTAVSAPVPINPLHHEQTQQRLKLDTLAAEIGPDACDALVSLVEEHGGKLNNRHGERSARNRLVKLSNRSGGTGRRIPAQLKEAGLIEYEGAGRGTKSVRATSLGVELVEHLNRSR